MTRDELDASDCIWAVDATLGEGPMWHSREHALYFVDIKRPALFRYRPSTGEKTIVKLDVAISCVAPTQGHALIAGFKDGVFALDPVKGERRLLVDPEPGQARNRLNDGRCDVQGNFWVGSMDDGEHDRTGALWRVAPSGGVQRIDHGYCITNGPAFSPSGRIFYHTDTMERMIYAFDLDGDGEVAAKRPFAIFNEADGYPDGLCVDAEGGVWTGHWGGGRLTRYLPDGFIDRVVHLPTDNVTCCAFGGDNLDTLFITTARKGLSPEQLRSQPLAGGLFSCRPGLRGLPTPSFADDVDGGW